MKENEKSAVPQSLSFDTWEELSDEEAAFVVGGRTIVGKFISAGTSAVKTAVNEKWNAIKTTTSDFLGIGPADIGTLPTGETATNLIKPLSLGVTINFLNNLFNTRW